MAHRYRHLNEQYPHKKRKLPSLKIHILPQGEYEREEVTKEPIRPDCIEQKISLNLSGFQPLEERDENEDEWFLLK